MKRPTVIKLKPRQTVRDGLVKSAAKERAVVALSRLESSLLDCSDDLRIATYREVIRLTSQRIDDPMRATGILGGAAADLNPVWTDGKTARTQAGALFKDAKP